MYRAGSGEPVVLLHGFTAAWRIWHPILADLVARYEVIAPTLPGHHGGPSYPADQPITFERSTDAVEGLLDELGVGTAHFVGNSMGGGIALELAKRGRARSVVALAPAGGWSRSDGEGRRRESLRQADQDAQADPCVERADHATSRDPSPGVQGNHAPWRARISGRCGRDIAGSAALLDQRASDSGAARRRGWAHDRRSRSDRLPCAAGHPAVRPRAAGSPPRPSLPPRDTGRRGDHALPLWTRAGVGRHQARDEIDRRAGRR